jgi:ferrous iron transport protein A
MKEKACLTDLKRGQKGVIVKLSAYDDMRRRLQDIGLIEGTVVECLGKSPLGDPTAFLIRGAVIALRSEDARRAMVWLDHEDNGRRRFEQEVAAAAVSQEDETWD